MSFPARAFPERDFPGRYFPGEDFPGNDTVGNTHARPSTTMPALTYDFHMRQLEEFIEEYKALQKQVRVRSVFNAISVAYKTLFHVIILL